MVITFIKTNSASILKFYQRYKLKIIIAALLLTILFAYSKPQQFADLWLTPDQQGQLLFNFEYYLLAAKQFSNTRWQAYSLYASEQFDQAATLYNQFEQAADILARANALAQARRYIKARDIYQSLLKNMPDNAAAQHNLKIVQAIIDDVNRMSESQQPEEGDSPKELGDEPQTGDGAEKKQGQKQKIKQLDAHQLLLDPSLNEMWLRQVQKDPALFLSNKFHMQMQQKKRAGK